MNFMSTRDQTARHLKRTCTTRHGARIEILMKVDNTHYHFLPNGTENLAVFSVHHDIKTPHPANQNKNPEKILLCE